MPGELVDDRVVVREQSEANRLYNKGWFGRPKSGGSLELDLVEAAYLLDAGRLRLDGGSGPPERPRFFTAAAGRDPDFEMRYLVYRELRERGVSAQVASPSQRAKAIDFLLPRPGATTPKGPSVYVHARSERSALHVDDLVGFARRCEADKVAGRIAVVDEESEVTTYEVRLDEPKGATPADTRVDAEADFVVDRVVLWEPGAAGKLHEREFFGKPVAGSLHLSLVEALHLSDRKALRVRDGATGKPLSDAALLRAAKKVEPGIEARRHVFDDLKVRGLVVKTGYKFGAHFRAYESSPESTHAPYLIHVHEGDAALEWPQVARAVRLAHGVRKTFLLASPGAPRPTYVRLAWVK
ncbi:MAG: tRNA-intron lyase [Euryarchaeota archaeon]|nr:tRNA-intron lyase [Euryarchaeota archaeon]